MSRHYAALVPYKPDAFGGIHAPSKRMPEGDVADAILLQGNLPEVDQRSHGRWTDDIRCRGSEPYEQIGLTGTISYLMSDHLGNIRALMNTSGNPQNTYSYTAYGGSSNSYGSATTTLQYAGQYTVATGNPSLQYMGARWYNAQTMDWMSRDPEQAGTNQPYLYVGDNPLNATDPLGLFPPADQIGAAVSSYVSQGENAVNTAVSNLGSVQQDLGQVGADAAQLAQEAEPFIQAVTGIDPRCGFGLKQGLELGLFVGLALDPFGGEEVDAAWVAERVAEEGAEDALSALGEGAADGDATGKVFPSSRRQAALDENPNTCVYCRIHTDSPQVDHIVPRARGGNATVENAQTTCPWCNTSKGARDHPVNPPPGYAGPWPPPCWKGVR